MLHLAFGERVLLADEMGLGKTIQAIAACALLRHLGKTKRVLRPRPRKHSQRQIPSRAIHTIHQYPECGSTKPSRLTGTQKTSKLPNMKTTFDLPPELVRKVKLRAVNEGKKLKDVAAYLLQRGLEQPAPIPVSDSKPVISSHSVSGLPFVKSRNIADFIPPTPEDTLALIQQVNEEEDLRRAGILD